MGQSEQQDIEKIEAILYAYPELVAEINLRLADHKEGAPLRAVSFDEPHTSPTNKFFSIVEIGYKLMDQLDEELQKKVYRKRRVDLALECLSEREFRVVSLRYWKRLDLIDIAVEMDFSRTTISVYKKAALKKLRRVGLANELQYNTKSTG